jgi:DNA-directed RNA polymerase subunit H (RpoH/RPB5)
MIRLKQILNEITFDLSVAFPDDQITYIGGKDNEYRFNTGKNEYAVAFKPEGESTYERVYHTTDRGLGNNFEDTKEGAVMAIAVNATVMKITLDFIKRTPDFSMIYMVPISRSRFNIVKKFLEKYLPKQYPFVAEASNKGENIIVIYHDEQTKNILSEIRINKPGTPEFKNNDDLINYLKKNPSSKKELIDTIWKNAPWAQNPNWDYILPGWYKANIERYGNYNIDDEILISNPEGDMVYISTHPLEQNNQMALNDMNEYKVKFLNNELYWYFY